MAGLLVNEDSLRLVIFGGKGGAGKTTSAAASAIHLARRSPQRRILLVSTDPAHSLADSLDVSVADDPVAVPGTDNLWVRQLDAPQADRRFHNKYDRVLKTLIDRGTFLDGEDAQNIVDLPLPGLDEIIAVRELANLLKENTYQLIIMDTAPTGHTLRLLALPEVMERWVYAYSLMQRKHKYMQRTFAGRCTPDAVDAFLKTLGADVRRVRDLLHSSTLTEFVPVANADPLSVAETRRLVDTLAKMHIAVRSLIINRVPADRDCPLCHTRHAGAISWLSQIDRDFESLNLVHVPLLADQVRGVEMLERFGEVVFDGPVPPPSPPLSKGGMGGVVGKALRHGQTPLAGLLRRSCKFILLGGKGGVGKTSLAAAVALKIAEQRPKDRVLVLSIDPAHSLSDCLACSVGNQAVRVSAPGLLEAKELDAEDLFKAYTDEYRRDIARAFAQAKACGSGDVELRFDREVMDELLSVWPSGLDEIMALVEVLDLADAYDVLVLDTAPTGHLLRFLEMCELARQWLKALFRIIIKHQTVINLTNVGEKLVRLSRDIRRVQQTLTDANRTAFVAVTIPEAMAIAETHRLLASLERLGMACRDLVINMVTPSRASCPFCRARRHEERSCIREIAQAKACGSGVDVAVTEVPMLANEIRGIKALNALGAAAFGQSGSWVRRFLGGSRQASGFRLRATACGRRSSGVCSPKPVA